MNQIVKLHLEAMNGITGSSFSDDYEIAATKSAEVTEQIAIEFEKWKKDFIVVRKEDYNLYLLPTDQTRYYTVDQLYKEFLKER